MRAFEEYPRPARRPSCWSASAPGLRSAPASWAAFGALYALGALVLIVAIEARRDGLRAAAAACGRFVLRLLPGLLLGYAVMALVWPWGAAEPLNPFRALQYFSRFFEEPWDELFGGALIKVTRHAAQLSADAAGAQAAGAVCRAGARRRRRRADRRVPRRHRRRTARAVLLLVALAAALPIAVAVAMRPAMYNGIRHFLFVVPPLAVLGGLAGAWLFDALRRRGHLAAMAAAVVFVIGLALPVVDMVRLHPYEYTSFQPARRRRRAARATATCSTTGACR